MGSRVDVVRVDCSTLLTQAEIARKLGKSRQAISQYIRGGRGPGGFSAPARKPSDTEKGAGPLWQWCDVAAWLCRHDLAPQRLLDNAEAIDTINCVLA